MPLTVSLVPLVRERENTGTRIERIKRSIVGTAMMPAAAAKKDGKMMLI